MTDESPTASDVSYSTRQQWQLCRQRVDVATRERCVPPPAEMIGQRVHESRDKGELMPYRKASWRQPTAPGSATGRLGSARRCFAARWRQRLPAPDTTR